jgi:hypothetical protein
MNAQRPAERNREEQNLKRKTELKKIKSAKLSAQLRGNLREKQEQFSGREKNSSRRVPQMNTQSLAE